MSVHKGLNRFYLSLLCEANGWEDPRFATFKQISDKGWHLNKGSHGVKVEYWMPYNTEEKRVIPWKDADLNNEKVKLIAKYFTVFNAKDIEGIPPRELPEKRDINPDKILDTICKNMDIEILNDGGNRAFYRPSEDKIHLPEPGYFESDYAYNSVALHELSHATGAAHRLNRDIQNLFGSPEYAFEELVAEISSAFMSNDLAECGNGFEMDNHKAYIQSWISAIKEKPEVLMQAIKEANRAADYLEVAAELVKEQKLSKEEAFEMGADKVLEDGKIEQSNYLLGAEIPENYVQDMQLRERCIAAYHLRGYELYVESDDEIIFRRPDNAYKYGETAGWGFKYDNWDEVKKSLLYVPLWEETEITEQVNRLLGVVIDKTEQYNHLSADEIKEDVKGVINDRIAEYNQYNSATPLELVDVEIYGSRSQGLHTQNSDLDILIEYKGDLKESDFFNILHQEEYEIGGMKVDLNPIREEESGTIKQYLNRSDKYRESNRESIMKDLKRNGFQPTRNLVNNIQKFNAVTGKDNNLADICEMSKRNGAGLNPDAQDLLENISSECRAQELAMALEQ